MACAAGTGGRYGKCRESKWWHKPCAHLKEGLAPWCHHHNPTLSLLSAFQYPPHLSHPRDQDNCSCGRAAIHGLNMGSSHNYPDPLHKRTTMHSYSKAQTLSCFTCLALRVPNSRTWSWPEPGHKEPFSSTLFCSSAQFCCCTITVTYGEKPPQCRSPALHSCWTSAPRSSTCHHNMRYFWPKWTQLRICCRKFNKRPLNHSSPDQLQLHNETYVRHPQYVLSPQSKKKFKREWESYDLFMAFAGALKSQFSNSKHIKQNSKCTLM